MSPGDVIDQLLLHPDQEFRTATILSWGDVVDAVKSGPAHMPMSPGEIEAARSRLRRLVAVATEILKSIDAARALHPAHMRPVEEGGR